VLAFARTPARSSSSVFPILKINTGVQNNAMADISSILTAQSSLLNPAVLPWLTSSEVSVEHISYFQDTNYSLLNYVSPLNNKSAVGCSLGYLWSGGITRTVADSSLFGYTETGSFGFSDMVASLSYGHKLSGTFSYGATVKAVREQIDDSVSLGPMASIGFYYYPPRNPRGENVYQLSAGIVNVGPQVGDFSLPSGAYFGLGTLIYNDLFLGAEYIAYVDNAQDLKFGFEYGIDGSFFLRAGYILNFIDNRLGDLGGNLTAGIGIKIDQLSFDYAWIPYGDLGQTHRLAVSRKFGAPPTQQKKKYTTLNEQ
jgi:hypothetical protein